MDADTAISLFPHLVTARRALGEAVAVTIREVEQEAGERLYAALARVEEVIDECTRIAPSLHAAPLDDWPEA